MFYFNQYSNLWDYSSSDESADDFGGKKYIAPEPIPNYPSQYVNIMPVGICFAPDIDGDYNSDSQSMVCNHDDVENGRLRILWHTGQPTQSVTFKIPFWASDYQKDENCKVGLTTIRSNTSSGDITWTVNGQTFTQTNSDVNVTYEWQLPNTFNFGLNYIDVVVTASNTHNSWFSTLEAIKTSKWTKVSLHFNDVSTVNVKPTSPNQPSFEVLDEGTSQVPQFKNTMVISGTNNEFEIGQEGNDEMHHYFLPPHGYFMKGRFNIWSELNGGEYIRDIGAKDRQATDRWIWRSRLNPTLHVDQPPWHYNKLKTRYVFPVSYVADIWKMRMWKYNP